MHVVAISGSPRAGSSNAALLRAARELAPDGFRLWVFQRNTQARDFYEHRGMRVVELTDGSRNEEHEPDALYEWLPRAERA